MIDRADAFIASLDPRISEVLDRCARCGKCVEVCPTAGVDCLVGIYHA